MKIPAATLVAAGCARLRGSGDFVRSVRVGQCPHLKSTYLKPDLLSSCVSSTHSKKTQINMAVAVSVVSVAMGVSEVVHAVIRVKPLQNTFFEYLA